MSLSILITLFIFVFATALFTFAKYHRKSFPSAIELVFAQQLSNDSFLRRFLFF